MSKSKRKVSARARAEPVKRESAKVGAWLCSKDAYEILTCKGYTSLAHNPEIAAGVNTIANLIGSMTIHLMMNTEQGDVRLQNGLSRLVDITPNRYMTRSAFIAWIVRNLYLEGDGNVFVYPKTANGFIDELIPIPPSMAYCEPIPGAWGYRVFINGRSYAPEDVLHFVLNPSSYYPWQGEGLRVVLKDIAHNLKQAAATERGFMESKWKPSVIVKVDGLVDEFASPAGRKKLLDDYVASGEAGEPWIIPSEQFSVETVRPLSLADLAISDMVTIDKRTVASVLGVPPFVLGVGSYSKDEWNNFVSSYIMPRATAIQQELTRKLLYSPQMYFRFNARSLYSYSITDLANVADAQFERGIMTGNEVRDWLNLTPLDGLDELIVLENYIPRSMTANQSKLTGGENGNG